MGKQQEQAFARLTRAIPAVTTLLLGLSFGLVGQSRSALAQIPIPVEPYNPANNNPATPAPTPIPVQPWRRSFCPRDLQTAITTIINRPQFQTARWGIQIEPVSEPTVLYEHNAELPLIPASNVKLFTTAAALRIIGDRAPQTLPTFENWVTVVNRDSDNDRADALLRHIGGQKAVRNALERLGVKVTSYQQVDGSGLSRQNRATPATLVTLLKGMLVQDEWDLFYQSLSIAGVNGTLRNRFRNTPVQGNLHGKTGTLNGVRALSGYIENTPYGPIVFSIVVNQPGQDGQVLLRAIDQIVLQMAQVERCP